MELKTLVEEALKYISNKYEYEIKEDIYFISIEMYKNKKEVIRVYKDKVETEISNEDIIVIDTNIEIKNLENKEYFYEYNQDTFFSKIYFNDENTLLIESCYLNDNTTPKSLALIINEISNISYNIRMDLLEMEV
ncbi:MAG: hypothetical protein KatS3mg068_2608 [Candidatus Sericytochromatia bacterium]|nr:MAG: hypothetical protein KatS3mg068_2608 [Candidatus Sericytochromatia bacterium]